MSQILSTVVFNHKSGLVEDQVVNTFAFDVLVTPQTTATLDAISQALFDFYNTPAVVQNASIATYLAPSISRTDLPLIKHYKLDGHLNGSPHGSPIRTDVMASLDGAGANTGLPAEVACCLSFHSVFGPDAEFGPGTRPRSRDRGRIYIGPLISTMATTVAPTSRVVPAPALISDLVVAAQNLRDDANTSWCVWSRKDAVLKFVTGVSVDDAFDTQRRRGEKPTARTAG